MKRFALLTALAASSLAYTAIAAPDHGRSTCPSSATACAASSQKDIVDTATAAGSFRALTEALEVAGLVDALRADGPFTVFAPTDDAFAALPEGTVESLLQPQNRAALVRVLAYHVVPGRVTAANVVELDHADTLSGQRLAVESDDDGVRIAGARVVKSDVGCSNGVIHVVDRVLMPAQEDLVSIAAAAGGFETLAKALEVAGLVEALRGDGPFTVFAPTDAAFAALPEGTLASLLEPAQRDRLVALLQRHVVAGRVYADQLREGELATLAGEALAIRHEAGAPRIDGAAVVRADIQASNGVIHVVDHVLLP